MDTGLLVIRVVIGLLLVGHGTQKLFGWFGGHGLAGTAGFFHTIGYRPGKPMATLAGLTEAGGGLLLALGLATPLAGAVVFGTMLNAGIGVHGKNGPWSQNGGYEYTLVLSAAAIGIAFTGAGAYSLDNGFDWTWAGNGWGIAATAAGLVTGLATVAWQRHNLRADTRQPTRSSVAAAAS